MQQARVWRDDAGGYRRDMDAITLLKEDHRRIEKLFAGFERSGSRAVKTRRRLVDRMAAELTMHATLEEHVFYPLVRQSVPHADAVVLESLEEHHVVKVLLKELTDTAPSDEHFGPKVAVLIDVVRHHVDMEERDIFPRMRKSGGRARMVEIGDAMRKLRHKARAASPKATRKAAKKTLQRVA
jgi:hemerythrin superfamily protein